MRASNGRQPVRGIALAAFCMGRALHDAYMPGVDGVIIPGKV